MTENRQRDARHVDAAVYQSFFREVNDRISDFSRRFVDETTLYICECREVACADTIPIRAEEYEAIREDSDSFLVVPGHEVADAEQVVGGSDRFLIVRNVGPSGRPTAERNLHGNDSHARPGAA